jgi:hypothetical protein
MGQRTPPPPPPTSCPGLPSHHVVVFVWLAVQESSLAGRQILAGYPGWLSSHGLDYGRRMGDMQDMIRGAGDAYNTLKSYGVTHIVVPWKHRSEFNIEFLNAVGTRVTSNGRYTVYEVSQVELTRPVEPCGSPSGAQLQAAAPWLLILFTRTHTHAPTSHTHERGTGGDPDRCITGSCCLGVVPTSLVAPCLAPWSLMLHLLITLVTHPWCLAWPLAPVVPSAPAPAPPPPHTHTALRCRQCLA